MEEIMKRIFIDVGANMGQTIAYALKPPFRIDYVIAFDPSPICCKHLSKRFGSNKKVTIIQQGLWKETCKLDLHNEGSQGGTVLADYQTTCNPEHRVTKCDFIRASDWFKKNVSNEDIVFLKLNCEGSECDVLMDLLESGEYSKVAATLIDFDVRKSPSAKHKEELLKKAIKNNDINNIHIYMGDARHQVFNKVVSK
jgi:FkbM family methyltransferase